MDTILGRGNRTKRTRNQGCWEAASRGFRSQEWAGTYRTPSQEASLLPLCAVVSSRDIRKDFLPDTLYPKTRDALLFQMVLGKQQPELYVSKFPMPTITVQSFLLKVKPSASPPHPPSSL